jgi:hypothetical protein
LNTAAGQIRAYAYAHNAPLPETGSFHEQVLAESILRERNLQYAGMGLIARLLGLIGGLSDKVVQFHMDQYKEELYQLRYNSKYVTATERWRQMMRNKAQHEARLMERVANMTSDEG